MKKAKHTTSGSTKARSPGPLKGPEYRYLGHFGKKKFVEAGHNYSGKIPLVLGAISRGAGGIGDALTAQAIFGGAKKAPTGVPGATQADQMAATRIFDQSEDRLMGRARKPVFGRGVK